jgi:hypothetical protein
MKGKTIQNPVYVCSNLNQKAIIGMDVINKFGLIYSPLKDTFHFEDTPINSNYFFQPKMPSNRSAVASLTVVKTVKIPPLTSISLSVSSLSSDHYRPPPGMLGLAHIGTPSLPYLNGGPGLVETNRLGEVTVRINNCSPVELKIERNTQIGFLESVCPSSVKEINSDLFISEIEKIEAKLKPPLLPND